jgi:glycerol uptake facilitator-like aquaporin
MQFILLQIAGCCAGAVLAHLMFELPPIQFSTHARAGYAQWLAEFVATTGLVLIVLGHRRTDNIALVVSAWIGAAYWFTSSTSFANPAITVARSLTDTFSGIRPVDVAPFVIAQLAGAASAVALGRWLFRAGLEKRVVAREFETP